MYAEYIKCRKRTLFRVETCFEIKIEKIKSAKFIGGYFCNIFNYKM